MKDIKTLKKKILKTKELSEVVNYFLDLMAQNKKLNLNVDKMRDNIETNPELFLVIRTAVLSASHVLKIKLNMVEHIVAEEPQEKFYHGYCMFSNFPVPLVFMWCSDYQTGIGAISDPSTKSHYFRFSISTITDKNKSLN